MMQSRQQYEGFIQSLQFERDEAIRTKTIETADLRRQNNLLKDCVRSLERQQASRSFSISQPTDTFTNDFHNFGSLDLGEDSWDEEYSFIGGDDLKMDGEETPQRQLTPRPPPAPQFTTTAAVTVAPSKADPGFSWNTFYMCLLFGAFIASQPSSTLEALKSNTGSASTTTSTAPLPSSSGALSALSEDYRVEAGNMLAAVLASDGTSSQDSGSSAPVPGHHDTGHPSSLDALSATLTSPTRHQQVAAAFSLTPSQYEHITNPDGILDSPSPHDSLMNTRPEKPTPFQAMFASMQAERDSIDKMAGLGGKARERSVLLDRVPEKVLRDFRRLVAESQNREDCPS